MFAFLQNLKEKHDLKTLLFYSSWAITLTSGISYVLGLVRSKVFAYYLGASEVTDIYSAAVMLPENLVSILIGTFLSAAFLPIFTKCYDKKPSDGHDYAHQILSFGIALVASLSILIALTLPYFAHFLVEFEGETLKDYIQMTRLMLLSPLIFAVSRIYGQVLISFKEFLWYGLASPFHNLGIIFGAAYLSPHYGVFGLGMGFLTGSLLHLLVHWLALRGKKYRFRFKWDFRFTKEVKETIVLTLPKLLQYGMWSFMTFSFVKIATGLSEGTATIYGFARDFQSLPVSLLGVAIALAMYTSLSHDAARGNFDKFIKDFKQNRFKAVFYTTLAAIALALVSRFMIQKLLGGGEFTDSDVIFLSQVLMVYCISIPLETLLQIYHRAYYSIKNTMIPSLMHTFTILLTIVAAFYLSGMIGVFALPVAFAGGLVIHVTVLALVFPGVLARKRRVFELEKEG